VEPRDSNPLDPTQTASARAWTGSISVQRWRVQGPHTGRFATRPPRTASSPTKYQQVRAVRTPPPGLAPAALSARIAGDGPLRPTGGGLAGRTAAVGAGKQAAPGPTAPGRIPRVGITRSRSLGGVLFRLGPPVVMRTDQLGRSRLSGQHSVGCSSSRSSPSGGLASTGFEGRFYGFKESGAPNHGRGSVTGVINQNLRLEASVLRSRNGAKRFRLCPEADLQFRHQSRSLFGRDAGAFAVRARRPTQSQAVPGDGGRGPRGS